MAQEGAPPPLTTLGKWSVGLGLALVAAAAVLLLLGDTPAFNSCTTVTTSERLGPRAATGLIETKRVVTCGPSGLLGGAPLILAVLGGVMIAPGVLRLLPPGKYAVGGVAADTTPPGRQAAESATAAAANFAALYTSGASPPASAVRRESPDAPPEN
jgi:hypothetical protein